MSFSKERQEYHLTPRGWIAGTFHRDFGKDEEPISDDRVLTMAFVDEVIRTRGSFESAFGNYIAWESDDKNAIERFRRKHGDKPQGF